MTRIVHHPATDKSVEKAEQDRTGQTEGKALDLLGFPDAAIQNPDWPVVPLGQLLHATLLMACKKRSYPFSDPTAVAAHREAIS